MASTKGRTIGYWITTGLLGVGFLASGTLEVSGVTQAVQPVVELGYPAYLLRLLGVAKILGAITILAPKLPRLKEWAYAGIVIDLVGAAYSHVAHGDGPDKFMAPVMFLAITLASYFLRPENRRLPDAS